MLISHLHHSFSATVEQLVAISRDLRYPWRQLRNQTRAAFPQPRARIMSTQPKGNDLPEPAKESPPSPETMALAQKVEETRTPPGPTLSRDSVPRPGGPPTSFLVGQS